MTFFISKDIVQQLHFLYYLFSLFLRKFYYLYSFPNFGMAFLLLLCLFGLSYYNFSCLVLNYTERKILIPEHCLFLHPSRLNLEQKLLLIYMNSAYIKVRFSPSFWFSLHHGIQYIFSLLSKVVITSVSSLYLMVLVLFRH